MRITKCTIDISKQEWQRVLVWAVILSTGVSLPYLYGLIISTPESQFSGFVIGMVDGHSYLAKMQQGRAGYWLFRLVYTPESHRGELFFIVYLLLGKIAGLANLSNQVALLLSRVITIPVGLFSFYYFAAHFSADLKMRQLALLIFGFTGGLGWLWLLSGGSAELGHMPVDLWVPDASFFLTALTFPHFPLAQGLLLLVAISSLNFIEYNQKRAGIMAAGYGLMVSLIHPHSLPIINLILGLYIFRQHYNQLPQLVEKIKRIILITLPSLPYLIYVAIVFFRNPAFVAWRVQSLTYSPAPIHYLLGFGFTLLFAVLGLVLSWRQPAKPGYRFLQVWAISVPILIYVPIALQRRFLDGYQAPLAILAALGLLWLVERIHSRFWRRGAVILALVLMSGTNIFLLGGTISTIIPRAEPVFIAGAEVEAARWLGEQTGPKVVLASFFTGNYLPTVATVRTFLGHAAETMQIKNKTALLNQFFAGDSDDFRRQLLGEYRITHLFYGPAEQAQSRFSPADAFYLELVYDNGTVQIYQVRNNLDK